MTAMGLDAPVPQGLVLAALPQECRGCDSNTR